MNEEQPKDALHMFSGWLASHLGADVDTEVLTGAVKDFLANDRVKEYLKLGAKDE